MPGVVTLELAATPAAQRGQVETQIPPGDLKTLPSVHQEEELEPEEILMCPADFSLAADTIHGWREDVGCWGSRDWSSPGSKELHIFDH